MQNKKIGITDGNLRIHEKKDYSPLTFTYLEKTLLDIIPDPEQVEYIIDYLKEKQPNDIDDCNNANDENNGNLSSVVLIHS